VTGWSRDEIARHQSGRDLVQCDRDREREDQPVLRFHEESAEPLEGLGASLTVA
jgi:hypothetical protein